jgi:cytochrome P450
VRTSLQAFAAAVVDKFATHDRAEMMAEWATPIPSAGIAMVLGLPLEDCLRQGAWDSIVLTDSTISASA